MGKYSYCTQCTFMKILNVYKTDIFTEFKKKKEPAAAHFPLPTVYCAYNRYTYEHTCI